MLSRNGVGSTLTFILINISAVLLKLWTFQKVPKGHYVLVNPKAPSANYNP